MNTKPITIAIVAAEISGDILGAALIQSFRQQYPNARFVGVAGQHMQALGMLSIMDMHTLSVMGISEVVRHLPDLVHAKSYIINTFLTQKIDIFIGIDAPDFNLRLAKILKKRGIFCVQYVSPSVWAWRQGRMRYIKQATHLVLCLFAFELSVYQKYKHPAVCVGHPLTQKLFSIGQNRAPTKPHDALKIALLAGSRLSEINKILPTLLHAFAHIKAQYPKAMALLPLAHHTHFESVDALVQKYSLTPDVHIVVPKHTAITQNTHNHDTLSISQNTLLHCNLALIASGTATFEAQLLGCPMVVVYKLAPISFWLMKKLIKIPYVALPNILNQNLNLDTIDDAPIASLPIVPELLQDDANPKNISAHACNILKQQDKITQNLLSLSQKVRQSQECDAATAIIQHYVNHKI